MMPGTLYVSRQHSWQYSTKQPQAQETVMSRIILLVLSAAVSGYALAETANHQQPPATAGVAAGVVHPRGDDKFAETKKKAEAGDANAQFALFIMYSEGKGITRNKAKAMAWLQKSAAGGYLEAQMTLWSIYHYGDGVPRDESRAMQWLRKAAAQGGAAEQYALGSAYWYGDRNFRDLVLAYAWLKLAAAQDGRYSETLNELEAKLTPAQSAAGQHLSSTWKKGDILQTSGDTSR
jgi:TPR repeat protein